MKIRFGLQLDGQQGWHVKNSLGEAVVGSKGMLGLLENQLGLVLEPVPQSRRVVQYLACLRALDNEDRFFHRTLQVDELGTAALLLEWRDLWYLHGWNGAITDSCGRLKDLADVEAMARGKVAPSEGERLKLITAAMKSRTPAITKVLLTTPFSAFPQSWKEVLAGLPSEDTLTQAENDTSMFLGQLQERLRRAQIGDVFDHDDRLKFRADGSVTIVRAETRLLAARWLADYLGRGVEDGVLLASDSASLLDDVMVAAGKARHGLSESSAFRPALQLLPMTLALLWAPLDFNVLISFLSHPVSPIRSYARRKIAGKIASQPGIGGIRWEETLTQIDEYYGEDAALVREQIATWIDHPRYEPDIGVPVVEVIARTQKLSHYFRGRLNDSDEAKRVSWNAGFAQTNAFLQTLEEIAQSGVTLIRPRQLQKLLTHATSRGSNNPKLVAQVGSLAVVDDPAALIESFDHVIWWQPVMPSTPKSYPWSKAECQLLNDNGIELPDVSTILESLSTDWLTPIFNAKKKLLIVLPPNEAEVHPVWQLIETLVSDIAVLSIEDVLQGGDHFSQSEPVPHTPLPQLRRWWYLPVATPLLKNSRASFSSLESYLFNPYQWMLKYPARLKASNILSVSDGFLLEGSLAHRLVELFFALPDALTKSETDVLAWFEGVFPQLIEEEGAVMLMQGRRSDLETFRYHTRRSLLGLLAHFKSAGVKRVESEREFNGIYPGGQILGYADLVTINAQGKSAIVDMKWGGTKKYSTKLAENSHLQLGIYAELFRQQTGTWPDLGYYILVESKLLTQHKNYFPQSNTISSKSEESTPHLWERFKVSYTWRGDMLKQGLVEVALDRIEATDQSTPPDEGLKMETLNPNYNDYTNLAGWN
jgi:hypothetical protein